MPNAQRLHNERFTHYANDRVSLLRPILWHVSAAVPARSAIDIQSLDPTISVRMKALLFALIVCFTTAVAQEPTKLTSLRKTYAEEQAKLKEQYVRALKKAEVSAMEANDLDAAIAFRDERLKHSHMSSPAVPPSALDDLVPPSNHDAKPTSVQINCPPGQAPANFQVVIDGAIKNHTFWGTRNVEKAAPLKLFVLTPSGKTIELGTISGDAFPVSEEPRRIIFPVKEGLYSEKGEHRLYIYNEGQATVSIWKAGQN